MNPAEEEIRRIVREEYRKIQNEDNEIRTKKVLALAGRQREEMSQTYFLHLNSEVQSFCWDNKRYPDSEELKALQKSASKITWL